MPDQDRLVDVECRRTSGRTSYASSWKNSGVRSRWRLGARDRTARKRSPGVRAVCRPGEARHSLTDLRPSCSNTRDALFLRARQLEDLDPPAVDPKLSRDTVISVRMVASPWSSLADDGRSLRPGCGRTLRRSQRHDVRAEVLGPAVYRLKALADGGPALELAIGTGQAGPGRSPRGGSGDGHRASSPSMVEQLRAKPGGADIPVTIGDMTTTRVDGSFRLVYLVFNTIVNLTSQDAQVGSTASRMRRGISIRADASSSR